VEITVKLERDDYVHGYMWVYYLGAESRSAVVGLVLMLLLALLGLSLLRRVSPSRPTSHFLIAPALAVGLAAALPLYTYCRARTTFSRRWWLRQPTHYTFDDQGIASRAPSYSGFREWHRIWRVEENGRSFLIYLSGSQVVVIPKRFFDSLGRVRTFRELVAQNCPRVNLQDT
jgi:hypothetical protein